MIFRYLFIFIIYNFVFNLKEIYLFKRVVDKKIKWRNNYVLKNVLDRGIGS